MRGLSLLRLYPFDFRAFGSSAQGDQRKGHAIRIASKFFCSRYTYSMKVYLICLTIVRSLDFARDDQREVHAIRIALKKDFLLEVFLFSYLIISTTVVLILVCRRLLDTSSESVLLFQPRLVSGGFHLAGLSLLLL